MTSSSDIYLLKHKSCPKKIFIYLLFALAALKPWSSCCTMHVREWWLKYRDASREGMRQPSWKSRCAFERSKNFDTEIHNKFKMDFQHRAGGKTGSGGVASASESNRDRRERLRQLALETIDLNKVCGVYAKDLLFYIVELHLVYTVVVTI